MKKTRSPNNATTVSGCRVVQANFTSGTAINFATVTNSEVSSMASAVRDGAQVAGSLLQGIIRECTKSVVNFRDENVPHIPNKP